MSKKLTDLSEVLYRQIHPNYFDKNVPSSDRFRPSKMDQNMLSVDRSSVHNAQASHELYTSDGKKSAAVFGVSVGEFDGEGISCIEDPTPYVPATADKSERAENKAHSLADYSSFDDSKQKLIGRRLQSRAIARGKLFP
jgi:hypothetical protein